MLLYEFYRVEKREYQGYTGIRCIVSPERFMTNDDGSGIFKVSGTQLAGNCQFTGGEKELLKWLNGDSDMTGIRFFKTESSAKKYAKKAEKGNPLEKMPLRMYEIGEVVTYLSEKVSVVDQSGETVCIRYDDGYETAVNYYELM